MILAQPTPCSFGAMAYSPATSSIVLANTSSSPAFLQDNVSTFTWSGASWALANSGLSNNPPLRTDTTMAYDTTGSQLVLFGGKGVAGTELRNDLWGYSAGGAWSQLEPNYNSIGLSIGTITTSIGGNSSFPIVVQTGINGTTGLTIRYKSYMFALSTGVLLMGGQDLHYMLQDNYLWANGAWSTLTPAATPSIRTGAAFASNGTNTAVIFGGANFSFMLRDTWVYTTGSSTWTQLTTNTPPSVRKDAVMAYYPTGGYYLLFGGQDTAGNLLNQTWTLTVSGTTGTWAQLTPNNSPSNRMGAMAAYDTSSSQMILFGGQDSKNLLGDTWQWNGTNWINLLNPIATY